VLSRDPFEELAALRLAEHTLESVLETVARLTKQTVPGADEVSVTVLDGARATTAACTGDLALEVDERQYERGYGPCLDGSAGGQVMHVAEMATEERWPAWAADASRCGVGSSLSIPMPLQREVAAALNIYSRTPHAFGPESIALAERFAAFAGVALANRHLYDAQAAVADQLRTAMESRAVIEQAKGIVMALHRCGAEDAFTVLVKRSQATNTKLRDVAEALVREASS
jgi:GAF domain-containing protein